jgi:hypothetical protein
MAIEIQLAKLANQSLSINLDNNFYDINVKEANGVMAVDIIRNGQMIVQGNRATGLLIPYEYLEDGNFAFITNEYEYPHYTQFNDTQFLIYFTQSEINEFRLSYNNTIAEFYNSTLKPFIKLFPVAQYNTGVQWNSGNLWS